MPRKERVGLTGPWASMHSREKSPVFPALLCYPGSTAVPLWVSFLPLYKEGGAGDGFRGNEILRDTAVVV